nr:3D domain-containing protein [uncultured Anaeromusa sp.]
MKCLKQIGTFVLCGLLCMMPSVLAATTTPPVTHQEQLVVQQGMRGENVMRVQHLLANQGFYAAAVDGVFGPQTWQAVADFQSMSGLGVTGVVDAGTLSALERAQDQPGRFGRSMNMKATAYSRFDPGCGSYTARGNLLHKGLVAVDPNVIPLGTRLYIPGYGFAIADDTGGAIKGHIIDLAFDSHQEAINFGVRHITVYIL